MATRKNILVLAFIAFVIFGVSYSQYAGGLSNVESSIGNLCSSLTGIVPIVAMLGVIGGGLIYAGGQMMGAETRARANVWATALLTGSIICVMIVAVAPSVLTTLYGSDVKCSATAPPAPPAVCGATFGACTPTLFCVDCMHVGGTYTCLPIDNPDHC